MKWETLKRRIAAYVDALPADEFNQLRTNAAAEGKTVAQYLDDIDIRLVASLRAHARPAFPHKLRTGMLWLDLNDKAEWVVGTKP